MVSWLGQPLNLTARIRRALAHLLVASAFLAPAAGWAAQVSLSEPFNAAKEFPNYFLPAEYRGKDPAAIPPQVIQEQRALLESALASVFERLTLPLVLEGESDVRPVRYFPYLTEQLRKVDPHASVYASGGVVRTAISYLYSQMVEQNQKHPEKDPSTILREISEAKDDLPAIQVRGIGSDFDVLVRSPAGKVRELQSKALEVTNSAAKAYGAGLTSAGKWDAVRNTFYILGDVRDYDSQIARSTRQGGTVVDYMAFDVKRNQLIDPPRFPGLADRIVAGRFQFAPPETGTQPEDIADTVIRGSRTLLEMPWLKLENEADFRHQAESLAKGVLSGDAVSERAIGQFGKGIRNSRYSGAHNRFYRSKPDSAENAVLELARALQARSGQEQSSLLPEFVDSRPISLRTGDQSELHGLPPELLTPVSEFKKHVAPGGVLYHGAPTLDRALAILRQGLFLSKEGQGTAAYGRGAYASPDRSVAQGYAGPQGMVLQLKLKDDPRIHILDWEKVRDEPAIRKWIEKAGHEGRKDIFEYLAREHGIDIILNHHVLIENSDAFELSGGIRDVALSLLQSARSNPGVSVETLQELKKMNQYLIRIGEKPILTPKEGADLESDIARKTNYRNLAQNFADIPEKEAKELLPKMIEDGDYRTLTLLAQNAFNRPDLADMGASLKRLLERSDQLTPPPHFVSVRTALVRVFAHPHSRVWKDVLKDLILHGDAWTRSSLANDVFSKPFSDDMKKDLRLLIEASDYSDLRWLAINTFSKPHTAGMADLLKLLIERAKDDPHGSVDQALIQHVFTQPHAFDKEELLKLVIERAWGPSLYAAEGLLAKEPWSESRYDYLREAARIQDPEERLKYLKSRDEALAQRKAGAPTPKCAQLFRWIAGPGPL